MEAGEQESLEHFGGTGAGWRRREIMKTTSVAERSPESQSAVSKGCHTPRNAAPVQSGCLIPAILHPTLERTRRLTFLSSLICL